MFEAIQASYEVLLPRLERGETITSFVEESLPSSDAASNADIFPQGKTQMQTMRLLIHAQVLICKRFEKEMSRLKYPMYSVLVSCIKLPSSVNVEASESRSVVESAFASIDRAKFVEIVVELIFRTCVISPANSEELIAENGVPILVALLDFYINLSRSADFTIERDVAVGIILYCVRTLSGVAFYEKGRDALKSLSDYSKFLVNWKRCVADQIFINNATRVPCDSSIKRYALEGLVNMAKDSVLQDGLIGCGVIWPLLRYAMMFDSTLDEKQPDSSDFDDVGVSIAAINVSARLSVRAAGVLSGLYGDGPKHVSLTNLLNVLLTTPIARMLRNRRTDAVLKVLNSNVERADIIWNVQMRKQLDSFLLKRENDRPESLCLSAVEEFGDFGSFQYDSLKDEVMIGGIFIRHFIKGGKESLALVENPINFFGTIVNCVANCLNDAKLSPNWIPIKSDENSVTNEPAMTKMSSTSNEFLLVMNTLRILCRVDGLLDDALNQASNVVPSVLLSLLELPPQSEVRRKNICQLDRISPSHVTLLL
jgi:hypothetical protein